MCICNIVKHYEFLRTITKTKPSKLSPLIRKASSNSISAVVELLLNAFTVAIYGENRVTLQRQRAVVNKLKNRKSIKLEFCRDFIIEHRVSVITVVTIVLNHLVESQILDVTLNCEDVEGFDDDYASHPGGSLPDS